MNELFLGDNLVLLKEFPDNVLDSVVTDPPYGINFMNKKWDYDIPTVEFWEEVYRVLKPGGHVLVFCGTRTQHRMVVNIEDAGFEIRDVITWLYGQGFPKSYNVAKGIEGIIKKGNANKTAFKELKGEDKEKGLGYSKLGLEQGFRPKDYCKEGTYKVEVKLETEEANEWDGWGTALKPACEFITLARKPISEKNIALNILKWGVGGINIDETRIESGGEIIPINKLEEWSGFGQKERPDYKQVINEKGRFPANLILDDVAGEHLFMLTKEKIKDKNGNEYWVGADRFFYCPKASKSEKNEGLEELKERANSGSYQFREDGSLDGKPTLPRANFHPTVKPIKLMEYLVKLITPKDGICLDPFMGSGSTGIACVNLERSFIGLELDKEYYNIAKTRIEYFKEKND